MGAIRKYAFVLALSLAVIFAYAPLRLEDFAKPRWLDYSSAIVNKSLAPAKPEAGVSPVDPIAAANVDEDLDYRIAQRMKSIEGWRSFLAAHPAGRHVLGARAELEKLLPVEKPPAPVVGQAASGASSDTKTPSEGASLGQPSLGSEVASNEICRRDEDRLERLSDSPTSDEAMRFLTELRCEKLLPELFRLTEHIDYQDRSAIVAIQSHSPNVAQARAARQRAIEPTQRATEPRDKTHFRFASRSVQPRRSVQPARGADRWAPPRSPPILTAFFGETPRTAFHQIRVGGSGRGGLGGGSAGGGVASAASAGGGPGGGAGSGAGGSGSGGGSGGGSGSGQLAVGQAAADQAAARLAADQADLAAGVVVAMAMATVGAFSCVPDVSYWALSRVFSQLEGL